MKIILNKCYGGYGVSEAAAKLYSKKSGKEVTEDDLDTDYRTDPILIEVVEELGDAANGDYAELRVVTIPDGMDYVIDEYDGIERLHQRVKYW